ncbi:DedA family protein [Kitasatospora camelliae]|uniref:DedA family protein n=1 Tax=Kitasatospora camelliae TaxID=3156397 RepID=A0AAU8JRN2_9ACTN
MSESLPGPLAHLAPLLDDYGYPAVGALVFLDNCGIPVPGQTILVLAAVYAGTGRLSIAGVVAVAVLAAVAGNSLGYLIGRTGGHAFVHRWGRYVRITPERMAKSEAFFARRGATVVTFARFVDGLRQTNGIIAGTSEMPWRRFAPANVAGAVLWVGVWASIGFFAGTNIDELYRTALRYQVYLLAAVAAALLAVGVRALLRRRTRRRADPAGAAPEVGRAPDGAGNAVPPGDGGAETPDGGTEPPDGGAESPDGGQRSGSTSNEDA